ncbi:hypothetical protein [Pseudomonas purpurea]|uniref:hypothetical protein n=1 Tax=Pseudomonas purpurea TaxID=3136737 RepID=UPI0032635397
MKAETWQGVQRLVDDYVKVGPDDRVIVIYASDSEEQAAWVSVALECRKISFHRVWMQPLYDTGFQERLTRSIPSPDSFTGRIVVITLERDTLSHHEKLLVALAPFERSRRLVFRIINACEALFSTALQEGPEALSARNTAILERALLASRMRITSPAGTDLRITLDNDLYRWVSNRGIARPGGTVVLPAGEVATFPASIEGVLVADFAFNVNAITSQDARLVSHPVTVQIKGRQAVSWTCRSLDVQRFLDECFGQPCVRNVGELGLGTNIGITSSLPLNSHINERCPGVHLGFGQHNQDPEQVGYDCRLHLDLIARGGLVWFDDDPVPLDLANLRPSSGPHPMSPRDEDAFQPDDDDVLEDCCGVMTCDGLRLSNI